MPETPKKFYLTTPIYYVNARPHIGHAYSTIAADVIARRHRLLGDDTFFLTGTDEHGQKVQRSAEAAGIPPQQFADQVSASFRNLWKRMGILDDSLSKDDPLLHRDFIRTTDARHKCGVQKLWRVLEERGAIYLSSYTGQYCVSEEMFVDGPPGTIGPDGKPTETVTEENYFFRLSDYQQPIIDLIESNTLHIQPEAIRNEVLSFLRGGLKDLSISRTSFTWGIPVPSSASVMVPPSESVILSEAKNPRIPPDASQKPTENHVIYVWLDALANYMTAIGYGAEDRDDLTAEQKQAEQAKFARYWPADLHLVGKEITRFHCVYWPAFLLALNPKLQHGAGEPIPQLTPAEHAEWAKKMLPKSVVANGWLLFEESKMSKSRGNVVRTETILDAFGPLCPPPNDTVITPPKDVVILSEAKDPCISLDGPQPPTKAQQDLFASDVLRYFLLREIPFGQDGSFSFDALITRYNADLANGYGNLVSRTLKMLEQYCRGSLPQSTWLPRELFPIGVNLVEEQKLYASPSALTKTLGTLSSYVTSLDMKISEVAPWKLAKSDDINARGDLEAILYQTTETIRIITALLYPVMPYATASVWRQLGLGDIEQAARNGELKDLKWGGLKPGTKLGALAPIFPRADKGLAQIMSDMESTNTPAPASPESAKSVVASSPTPELVQSVASALSPSPDATAKPATPTITIDDFAKVDLRVAQIVVAERIPKTDKLLRLEVDLGPSFTPSRRQILAGIAEHYAPETLIGRKVVIVANLAPRKMRGLESQGMIVAASLEDHGRPSLAGFLEDVELGARLR